MLLFQKGKFMLLKLLLTSFGHSNRNIARVYGNSTRYSYILKYSCLGSQGNIYWDSCVQHEGYVILSETSWSTEVQRLRTLSRHISLRLQSSSIQVHHFIYHTEAELWYWNGIESNPFKSPHYKNSLVLLYLAEAEKKNIMNWHDIFRLDNNTLCSPWVVYHVICPAKFQQ